MDTSVPALDEVCARATARDLAHRATFGQADASGWRGEGFDAVLCFGATHAFGGRPSREPALELAREHRRQYLAGYRRELGFATVVLHDVGR